MLKLNTGDKVKFDLIPIGHYFTDLVYIWQSVKSGEVYPKSLMPELPVMVCRGHLVPQLCEFEINDWVEDFKDHEFIYLGEATKEEITALVQHLQIFKDKKNERLG